MSSRSVRNLRNEPAKPAQLASPPKNCKKLSCEFCSRAGLLELMDLPALRSLEVPRERPLLLLIECSTDAATALKGPLVAVSVSLHFLFVHTCPSWRVTFRPTAWPRRAGGAGSPPRLPEPRTQFCYPRIVCNTGQRSRGHHDFREFAKRMLAKVRKEN